MPRETIILECTEARKESKPPSRYMSTRNKKLQTDVVEKESTTVFCVATLLTAKLKLNFLDNFLRGS